MWLLDHGYYSLHAHQTYLVQFMRQFEMAFCHSETSTPRQPRKNIGVVTVSAKKGWADSFCNLINHIKMICANKDDCKVHIRTNYIILNLSIGFGKSYALIDHASSMHDVTVILTDDYTHNSWMRFVTETNEEEDKSFSIVEYTGSFDITSNMMYIIKFEEYGIPPIPSFVNRMYIDTDQCSKYKNLDLIVYNLMASSVESKYPFLIFTFKIPLLKIPDINFMTIDGIGDSFNQGRIHHIQAGYIDAHNGESPDLNFSICENCYEYTNNYIPCKRYKCYGIICVECNKQECNSLIISNNKFKTMVHYWDIPNTAFIGPNTCILPTNEYVYYNQMGALMSDADRCIIKIVDKHTCNVIKYILKNVIRVDGPIYFIKSGILKIDQKWIKEINNLIAENEVLTLSLALST